LNEPSKVLKFELSPHDLKIKNLLKNEFLVVEIMAISDVYPNRNKSHFTKEAMEKALPTFHDKPILGAFDKIQDDFKGHDDDGVIYDQELQTPYYDYGSGQSEIPLGTIRQSDTVEMVQDKDGLNWIKVSAALWVNYSYRQVKKILKSGQKKVSVEIEVNDYHVDENNIQVIDDFTLLRITILGQKVTEAIPNAHLSITELLEDAVFQKRAACLSFAYKELDKAMGIASDTDIKDFAESAPLNNEHSDEINMETNQRGGEKLTYEEKRQLLELALNRRPENVDENEHHCFVWVADCDDSNVYYQNGDGYFSAPYTFEVDEENHTQAVIDFENKVAVVRSWKAYSAEENEDSKEDEKEVEACDNKGEESCEKESITCEAEEGKEEEACNNEVQEETCNEVQEEACDGKEEESCGEQEACESCDDKQEETCESCGDKEVEETCPVTGEEVNESVIENEACDEKQENFDDDEEDDNKNEDEKPEDGEEEPEKEDDACEACESVCEFSAESETAETINAEESVEVAEIKFSVNDKEYTAEEFKAEFERISNELSEMTSRFNAANDKLVEIYNNDLYTFACGIVDCEEDLTKENAMAIKDTIKASCLESKFSCNEEVQKAAEHLIADALYAQKKMSKKSEKEFSSTIVKNSVNNSNFSSETSDSTDKLKTAIAKLRRV